MRGEILGIERRRFWRDEDKLEIVRSVGIGGATVTQVAQRHDVTRQQIYKWRHDLKKKGLWSPDAGALFFPLGMPVTAGVPVVQPPIAEALPTITVELCLRGGRSLHFDSALNPVALTALIRAVGEDISELLDMVARLKKSCRRCERMVQEPAPSRPIPGSMVGPNGQPADVRYAARQKLSRPKVEAFFAWSEQQFLHIPGKSDLAKAFRYGLARQKAFSPFLADDRVAIDNNTAERALRPIGIGRKSGYLQGLTPVQKPSHAR